MKQELTHKILYRIVDIIHNRDKSLKQQTEEIYNIVKKYRFNREDLESIENRIVLVYQIKTGINLISSENPFYNMCEKIANIEYEEFIENMAKKVYNEEKKEIQVKKEKKFNLLKFLKW